MTAETYVSGFTCSVKVPELCGQPATAILLVRSHDGDWEPYPRCDGHPPQDSIDLLAKVDPLAVCIVVSPAALGLPDDDELADGPEQIELLGPAADELEREAHWPPAPGSRW